VHYVLKRYVINACLLLDLSSTIFYYYYHSSYHVTYNSREDEQKNEYVHDITQSAVAKID